MNRNLEDLNVDPELERRLRTIASHEPEMPARIARYAADVAAERAERTSRGDLVLERVRRPGLVPRPGRVAFALASVAVVLAVGTAGLIALRPNTAANPAANSTTSSPSPEAPAVWGGLQWRDFSATAFPASGAYNATPTSVAYWHGAYYANPAATLWSSTDGARWHQVDGAPDAETIVATDDLLVLQGSGCATALNYTTDGQTWKAAELPLGGATCDGMLSIAATPVAVAVVVWQSPEMVSQTITTVMYRSTDGVTWTVPEMPADMAGADAPTVMAGRSGFLADGCVRDMSTLQVGNGYTYSSCTTGVWYSSDGSSWQKSTVPDSIAQLIRVQVHGGSLGDWVDASGAETTGKGYHSVDDVTWIADSEPATFSRQTLKLSSDGTWILAQTPGPTFYVSQGDGTWRQLVKSGDAEGMPDGGQSWVMPGGVLYIAGGHVFVGTPIPG
jgi:hypothetical protein